MANGAVWSRPEGKWKLGRDGPRWQKGPNCGTWDIRRWEPRTPGYTLPSKSPHVAPFLSGCHQISSVCPQIARSSASFLPHLPSNHLSFSSCTLRSPPLHFQIPSMSPHIISIPPSTLFYHSLQLFKNVHSHTGF